MKDLVHKVWYFDIQDTRLPVIVSYVLWSYFYPVQNDAAHHLSLSQLEEALPDTISPVASYHGGWQENFNERVNNPKHYICLNPKSQHEFMGREKKPTLREGFEELKLWLSSQGIGPDDDFIVAMWW